MIIGNGLISNAFKEYSNNDDYLIFASGVSNSGEDRDSEFNREFLLIKEYITTYSKFIYFSTINDGNSKYFIHKRNIENYISSNSKNYLIFRLPNVVGNGGNVNNIFNYLNQKILNDEVIKVQDINRSLIDIDDVKNICEQCFNIKNTILDISIIEEIKVIDIVNIMSDELNKKTEVEIIGGISKNYTNSQQVDNVIKILGIDKESYTKKIIKKYIKK